jgi:hypothetical protein
MDEGGVPVLGLVRRDLASRCSTLLAICLFASSGAVAQIPLKMASERVVLDGSVLGFSRIMVLSPLGTDRLAIVDRGAPAPAVYSLAGNHIADLGRRGEGPGEHRSAGAIGATGDGIWLVDVVNNRVNRFSADGKYIDYSPARLTALELPEGFTTELTFTVLAPIGSTGFLARGSARSGQSAGRPLLVSVPAQGNKALVLGDIGNLDECRIVQGTASGSVSAAVPFCDRRHWAYSPDGRFVAFAEESKPTSAGQVSVRITVIRSSGDTLGRFVRSGSGRSISKATADSAVRMLQRQLGMSDRAAPADLRGRISSHQPLVQRLMIDDEAGVWVVEAPGSLDGDLVLSKFSQVGTPLMTARVRGGVDVRVLLDGAVLGVRTDSDGVPSVVVIRPP